MPSFKVSKDRLAYLLGTNADGDLKLSPVFIYYSENPRILKNYPKSNLPMFQKQKKKTYMTTHPFTTWFTDYFKPTVGAQCSDKKKKITFKTITVH